MRIFHLCAILIAAHCFGQNKSLQLVVPTADFDVEGATAFISEADIQNNLLVGERDGEWIIGLTVASSEAHGLQFQFENVLLPVGARLVLYGKDESGVFAARAEYSGTGPLHSGEFWSDAVSGSEALIEVSFKGEHAADLPFKLKSVRHLTAVGMAMMTAGPRERSGVESEPRRGLAIFRGVPVAYEVIDGLAIFEGDMVLGAPQDLDLPVDSKLGVSKIRESVIVNYSSFRWPSGVIPYVIDSALPNKVRITDAISHWNTVTGGSVRLVPRTTESAYVRFAYTTSSSTCSSYVGRTGMAGQPITVGYYCATGNIIHEIGHAVGLFHEHSRRDRDNFVRILWENIQTGKSSDFSQVNFLGLDVGPYDYGSIMHYPTWAFSRNGLPTIQTIPPGIPVGQRAGLSAGDVSSVLGMYPAPLQPATTNFTISSNPAGLQLSADGQAVTTPVTFSWAVGSTHLVSASSYTNGSTRYLFNSWSNGGPQAHSLTVTGPGSVTASFSRQHALTARSLTPSLGSVSAWPSSHDSFYAEGTLVQLLAEPTEGSCLSDWKGISAAAASPLYVTVSKPYNIEGSFAIGAITVAPSLIMVDVTGGTISAAVTATQGCRWTAVNDGSTWISITSGAGYGSGTLTFNVAPNTGAIRLGSIRVGNSVVKIAQRGI